MSSLKKLHAAILQYLDEAKTDYAIMVNGVWGSGKTYFLKQKLFPELEKSKPDLKLIYISLFGVTGSNDLNKKIYLEIYPFLNSKVAKTIGVIGKVVISKFGFSEISEEDQGKLLETLGDIDKETLIVFDDLERLDAKLLVEILGYINQMVEHNNIKVIISANEKEIFDAIGKKKGSYKRYIEKVVRHKLLFELDFREIGNEILVSIKIDTKHHSPILAAFDKGGNRNLRTLQFVSSMSLKLLESLQKAQFDSDDLKSRIEGIALFFFSSIAIEAKSSHMSYLEMKKLASWSADKPFDFSKIDFSKLEVVDEGDRNKKLKNKDSSVQQDYFDRYYAPNQMMYIDSLVEFLESGYWDEERFLEEMKNVAKYLTTKGVSESSQVLDKLANITYVDDDKVEEVVEGVLKHVRQGNYQVDKYFSIYNIIQSLISDKIIKYKSKQLYKEILVGITECKDEQATMYIEDYIRISSNASVQLKNVYDKTIKRNQEIKAAAYSKVSSDHYNELFEDSDAYNRKYLAKQGEFIPCLHYACSTKDFLKKYSELTNAQKVEFNRVFYQRQKSGVTMDKSELGWLRELKRKLQKEIKKDGAVISMLNKKNLTIVIDKILETWEPLEHQLDS